MSLLLVFAITLLVAVLVSGWAQQTVLSTAVLFIVARWFERRQAEVQPAVDEQRRSA